MRFSKLALTTVWNHIRTRPSILYVSFRTLRDVADNVARRQGFIESCGAICRGDRPALRKQRIS